MLFRSRLLPPSPRIDAPENSRRSPRILTRRALKLLVCRHKWCPNLRIHESMKLPRSAWAFLRFDSLRVAARRFRITDRLAARIERPRREARGSKDRERSSQWPWSRSNPLRNSSILSARWAEPGTVARRCVRVRPTPTAPQASPSGKAIEASSSPALPDATVDRKSAV